MAASIEQKIKLGVAFILIVLFVNAFLSYEATRTLIDNDQRVRHTYQVINELEVLLSSLKDAETGERGYIITGKDEYLQPYEKARVEIDGHVRTLQSLTSDNPEQQSRIPALQRKVNDRIEILKEGIDLTRAGDSRRAHEVIASGAGKRMMDDLRLFISAMEADEEALLNKRTDESRGSQKKAILTFVVANLVACSVLLLTAGLIIGGVNARKQVEDDLRRQRQLLQVTLSSIADAVIACDTKGCVTFLNPVAESLTGWTQSEAEGQSLTRVFDVVNERTRQAVENPALRAMREGTIVGLANHTVLRTKSGTEVPIDDSASPIKTVDGILMGAVLVFRDITDRRRSEDMVSRANQEQLRLLADAEKARARAEAASRAKDEFLAMLSHELRTPLTAVFGWVQLLQSREVDEATRTKAMQVIDRNIRVQTQLIDDLLSISRIISGKLHISRALTDPRQVVTKAIDTARPSAAAKDITLQYESDPHPPAILADEARVQQIVWNLLSNAVKFTPKGGKISVYLRTVPGDLEIVVMDNGEGIAPEFLPQVFNRFSQADGSTTRVHGGLGLGLALVRQLVELHGGTVKAESAGIGKGSTFTVRLPLPAFAGSAPSEEEAANPEIGAILRGVRVLLAEDDPDTQDMIGQALRDAGASVIPVKSGEEALRQVAKDPPDVLISDIGMPDMDGYRLLSLIQAQVSRIPPAIALTAYATEADKQLALAAGFQSHVVKPVELRSLVSAVAAVMKRS